MPGTLAGCSYSRDRALRGSGCPLASHCCMSCSAATGWSMGTMCPALATRAKVSGPSRLKVPPAHACGRTLHASGAQARRGHEPDSAPGGQGHANACTPAKRLPDQEVL